MITREKELLSKAGLDESWTVVSVAESTWAGTNGDGKVVPMRSVKAKFTKTEDQTVEFVEAA